MKVMAIITVVLIGLAGIGGHLALRGDSGRVETPEHNGPSSWSGTVSANGVVEGARPEVALRPEVAGTIAALHVRENQDVIKGTLLVELQNDTQKHQIAVAQAEVAIARAQLDRLRNGERAEKREALAALEQAKRARYEQAMAQSERTQQLGRTNSVSQEQVDDHRFTMLRAQAEWQEAKAERAVIEAQPRADEIAASEGRLAAAEARLRMAQAELAKTRLLAPANGRILRIYAEPGEAASPTAAQPVLLLADLSKHRVRAFVEELDAARLRVGQAAVVTADGLPGKEFAGKVALLLPRMGQRTPQSDLPGEYKDIYFREALIDLEGGEELPLSLRVRTQIRADP